MQQDSLTWDLNDIFPSTEAADAELSRLATDIPAFAGQYQGAISKLAPDGFVTMLDAFNNLEMRQTRVGAFADLRFRTHLQDAERQKYVNTVEQTLTELNVHLVFFPLELIALDDATWHKLVEKNSAVKPYHHWLDQVRKEKPHILTEPEEKILLQKHLTSSSAWTTLYDKVTSELTFDFQGKSQTLDEILQYLHDPSRDTRRQAAECLTDGLLANKTVTPFIYNTLLQDKSIGDKLRCYDYPEQVRYESDEIEPSTVAAMTEAVTASFNDVARYFRLKAKVLGINDFQWYDRFAPYSPIKQQIPVEEAREIVATSYRRFSDQFAEVVERAFDEQWIDAMPRAGKAGGAFCAWIGPNIHPYVLLNYTSLPRDVMTIAHELGHATHDVLSSRNAFLEGHPSLATAEMASVFGEAITFDALFQKLDSKQDKIALLGERIEDIISTVFRQVSMFQFEQAVHAHRREKGELAFDELSTYWQNVMTRMFGDTVIFDTSHSWTWLYVPHIIHTPFYVYSYAFGLLLTLALYKKYQHDGKAFTLQYTEALSMGGSASPKQILSTMNINISDSNFWRNGLAEITRLIDQFEALVKN